MTKTMLGLVGLVVTCWGQTQQYPARGGSGTLTEVAISGFDCSGTTSIVCEPNGSVLPELGTDNTYTGGNDFSGAAYTAPFRYVASDPATCSVGQWVWNTTSNKLKRCSATDTWTEFSSGAMNVCGTGTSTSNTTLTDLATVTLPVTLQTNDMVRITARYQHGGGTSVAPRHAFIFGSTNLYGGGGESAWTATDTDLLVTANVRVIGSASQLTEMYNMRSNNALASTNMTSQSETTASVTTVKLQGRMTSSTSETVTVAHYCVEVIR